jgi:hypothetical protein
MSAYSQVQDTFERLRTSINASVKLRNEIYQKKDGSWDRLWAAMDALDDAQVAIDKFGTIEGVSYLELYGLLQSFVVQQDGIDHVRQTVVGAERIDWKRDQEPKLNKIRRLRNEAVGHPASIKTKAGIVYSNIDRSSISRDGFKYLVWDQAGAHSNEVDLRSIVKTQRSELERLAGDTCKEMEVAEREFVKQFAGDKLKTTYDQVSHYQFEKLYLYESGPEYANTMFKAMEKTYAKLRRGFEERFGDFETTINAPGLKITIDEIDEIIARVRKKLDEGVTDLFDFNVYIEVLEQKWSELGALVDEVDEKFSSKQDF